MNVKLSSGGVAPLVTVVLAIGLAGCSSAPDMAFDRARHPEIRRIALLDSPEPERYGAANSAPAAALLGPLGLPLILAETETKSAQATRALAGHDLRLGTMLTDAVEAGLRARGYDVVRLGITLPPPPEGYIADSTTPVDEVFGPLKTDADAILDVALGAAGFEGSSFEGYRPVLQARARLVHGRSRTLMFNESVMYGPKVLWTSDRIRSAAPEYRFESFDAVIAAPARAAEGLRAGTLWVADRIVSAFPAN